MSPGLDRERGAGVGDAVRFPRTLAPFLSLLLLACGGGPATAAGSAAPSSTQARDRVPRQRSVERYVAMLESPGRARWQRPDALVASLGIDPGSAVADLGTGSGYFLPQLDAAVGAGGRVVAQDIDEDLVAFVGERAEREGLVRVVTRLGEPDDPHLEPDSYDVILMVDVYHHVSQPAPFLAHVRRALKPDGRFFVFDFAPGDHVPTEISGTAHRIEPARVIADGEAAGLVLRGHRPWEPYQFVVELARPAE
jgi:SAM-dependent methyltransferase